MYRIYLHLAAILSVRTELFKAFLISQVFLVSMVTAQGPGFPNVTQEQGKLISGPWAETGGRTAVVAYHQGFLITQYEAPGSRSGSDGQARYFDISDLKQPVEKKFDNRYHNMIGAHGYWQEGAVIRGIADWTFEGNKIKKINNDQLSGGRTYYPSRNPDYRNRFRWPNRGMLFQPYHVTAFWSYGNTDGEAGLFKGTELLAAWYPQKETGVVGHPFIIGNYLYYLSDQSDTGIAVYDISEAQKNPGTKPALIGLFNDTIDPEKPGVSVGGYWPEIWSGHGKVKAVFPDRGDGIHIVDITDPTDMVYEVTFKDTRRIDWSLKGDPAYAQFQDDYAFIDRYKINMMTLELEHLIEPNQYEINVSQFSLPIGNLLVTGGYHIDKLGRTDRQPGNNTQGMAIWAHQTEPDTKAPVVGFHVPKRNSTGYPVDLPVSLLIHETLRSETLINGDSFLVRPVNADQSLGDPVSGRLVFSFNDVLTFTPDEDLAVNTTYEVRLPAGGIQDAVGNGIAEFSYRFSTGATVISDGGPSVSPRPPAQTPGVEQLDLQVSTNRKGKLKALRFELSKDSSRQARARKKRVKAKIILSLNGQRVLKFRSKHKRRYKLKLRKNKKIKRLQVAGINSLDLSVSVRKKTIARGSTNF